MLLICKVDASFDEISDERKMLRIVLFKDVNQRIILMGMLQPHGKDSRINMGQFCPFNGQVRESV
jgi:hypothetical protein